MSSIKLSADISIDLEKLIESRALFQANSGGGKSWAVRRFVEQAFGKKQIIIIDPEGEFGNMRSEYDFVYVGTGGDAPAEPRSAALLARRLLETKANAIIDIYELGSQRGEFVKNFFEACVNMPKDLWTDCFFICDETHKFAPEKGQGESVALQAVIDMASLGRKRGYCLIAATQRPSKLSKDVVAELNNKIIGRASLDIDRKRSAEELGFHTKEEILSLRNLAPGEFYVFGPAISQDVVRTVIGDVKVKPPKRGQGKSMKIAPPTAKVKALLAKLADLPQEAEKEAKTATELKAANATLKAENARLKAHAPAPMKVAGAPTKAMIDEALQPHLIALASEREAWKILIGEWNAFADRIGVEVGNMTVGLRDVLKSVRPANKPGASYKMPSFVPVTALKMGEAMPFKMPPIYGIPQALEVAAREIIGDPKPLTGGARKMLGVLASRYPADMTRSQVAHLSKLSPNTGSYANNLSALRQGGLIVENGKLLRASEAGIEMFGGKIPDPETPEQVQAMWLASMTAGARKMLGILIRYHPSFLTRDQLAEQAGLLSTTGSYANNLSTLRVNELIEENGKELKASDTLFDL